MLLSAHLFVLIHIYILQIEHITLTFEILHNSVECNFNVPFMIFNFASVLLSFSVVSENSFCKSSKCFFIWSTRSSICWKSFFSITVNCAISCFIFSLIAFELASFNDWVFSSCSFNEIIRSFTTTSVSSLAPISSSTVIRCVSFSN